MSVFDESDGPQSGFALAALAVSAIVPLCGIVGVGLEYARASFLRSHLQTVADAAAFDASRAPSRGEAEYRIAALFPAGEGNARVAQARLDVWQPGAAQVSIDARVTTRVMAALGNPYIPVKVRAAAVSGQAGDPTLPSTGAVASASK